MSLSHRIPFPFLLSPLPFPFSHSSLSLKADKANIWHMQVDSCSWNDGSRPRANLASLHLSSRLLASMLYMKAQSHGKGRSQDCRPMMELKKKMESVWFSHTFHPDIYMAHAVLSTILSWILWGQILGGNLHACTTTATYRESLLDKEECLTGPWHICLVRRSTSRWSHLQKKSSLHG